MVGADVGNNKGLFVGKSVLITGDKVGAFNGADVVGIPTGDLGGVFLGCLFEIKGMRRFT